jgi:anti-anti-sigma regulatory factor
MLRITVEPELDRIRLKLEGDLSGAWVAEVEESWLAACSMRGDRQLYLDLTDVQHVDPAGRYLIGLLRCSGAHLVASGVRMTELVRTIQRDWPGPKAP